MTGTVRKYGGSPYRIAALHGGPGAAGSIAPVARELGKEFGILEPIQTALTVSSQIEELKAQLEQNAKLPAVLIGHSWGAMLAFMFAGTYPRLVSRLILVGSGCLEEKYAQQIKDIRLSRVAPENRAEAADTLNHLSAVTEEDKGDVLSRLGEIMDKSDNYDPLPPVTDPEPLDFMPEVHVNVWNDAKRLRESGEMLQMGKGITCPVVVIHGDYDPHPIEGVVEPLTKIGIQPITIILDKCGHEPWIERHARDRFFESLREHIKIG